MRRALVFGGSGQIGKPLLHRLLDAGWGVVAVSRRAQVDAGPLRWLRGDLEHVDGLPAHVDAIFSCGPLDHFARWYAQARVDCPRVIAFGSTSAGVKQDSADLGERDLAARLLAGEQGVFAAADARRAGATVLRPTLVYGAGGDRTLTRIAAVARRWGRIALPRDATGLRQPVHVDDLAQAAFDMLDVAATHDRSYALPGGEALAYREMVARVLAALRPPASLHLLSPPLFGTLLRAAHAAGLARDLGEAAIARMREDLVFDATPAQRDFGYAPRKFMPTAEMFVPNGAA